MSVKEIKTGDILHIFSKEEGHNFIIKIYRKSKIKSEGEEKFKYRYKVLWGKDYNNDRLFHEDSIFRDKYIYRKLTKEQAFLVML